MKTAACLASAVTVLSVLQSVSATFDSNALAGPQVLRRAHRRSAGSARRHRRHQRRAVVSSCNDEDDDNTYDTDGASGYLSASASASGYAAAATASSQSSASTSSLASYHAGALNVGTVYIGMLPDGGGDGGAKDTMATLNKLISATGNTHATFGQYAQAQSGTAFDGSQLLQVMDDLKASGAIFEPAVMPTGGWQGLTYSDNSQAVNICNVMKKFTDEGIEVRLRFAHEVNYYLTDGTYSGTAADFKQGWDVVAKACRSIAPSVKMFFTPNVASEAEYDEFFPTDPSTVDLIGIDYYPSSNLQTAFLTAMKPFHDKYTSASTLFAIGETGLGYAGSASDKLTWLQSITAAKSNGMQYLTSAAWFNYQKGYNFKVCDPNDSSTTGAYVSFLSSS